MDRTERREPAALHLLGSGMSRRFICVASIAVGLVYPFWHLLGPEGPRDPWLAWWVVGAGFIATGWVAALRGVSDETVRLLFYACPWLVTGQLMLLAQANDMHPFYSVGSMMAILSSGVGYRSMRSLAAFGGFVFCLATALVAVDPTAIKLAYWFGPLPVLVAMGGRLQVHLGAAQSVESEQELLEQRVRERTAELTRANEQLRREMEERALLEDQLRLSQKMQAVGRLAGGIAHDFNNVLTVIGFYGHMLLDRANDEAMRRDVEEIVRAGERAHRLTARLLSFARGSVTQPIVLDLNAAIREFTAVIRSVTGEDVETQLDLSPDLMRVRVDRSQLEQSILNLVLNARDAMPGGGKLGITTRNLPLDAVEARGLGEPGRRSAMVQLLITDTGVGMDRETQSRAFEPFFTTKPPDRGTGLGLSTVYGMVQQANGDVRLKSEPGFGTSFEILLPALELPAEERRRAATVPVPRGRGQCILLVEDDAEVRQVARRILRDGGYTVLDAEDGDVALVILEETDLEVELVLTDVVMPRMSGFDLAERVAEGWPDVPVLFMSGHLNHPSLQERQLPAEAVLLAKPFTPNELLERVATALGPELP